MIGRGLEEAARGPTRGWKPMQRRRASAFTFNRNGDTMPSLGGPCQHCGTTQMWGNYTRCCDRCYLRQWRAARRVEPSPRRCAICGSTFTPKRRNDAKFCRNACRQLSYRDRTTIPDVKVDNRKRSRAELEKRILSLHTGDGHSEDRSDIGCRQRHRAGVASPFRVKRRRVKSK